MHNLGDVVARGKPFEKGWKGGPGRPKGSGTTARAVFASLLGQVDPEIPGKTRYQIAAEKLWIESQSNPAFMLDCLKWQEGSSPPPPMPDPDDTEKAEDDIKIPKSDVRFEAPADRQPTQAGNRKRKAAKGTRNMRASGDGKDVPDPSGNP